MTLTRVNTPKVQLLLPLHRAASSRQVILTEAALQKLIHSVQDFPRRQGWLARHATPDGQAAPVPEKASPNGCRVWRGRGEL